MNNEAIKKIAESNGFDEASRQLFEEVGELIVAVNKYHRGVKRFIKGLNPPPPKEPLPLKEHKSVIEEISDTIIMIEQIKHLLTITDKNVDQIIDQKLNRQLERIEKNEID
jgi:NTP pyrophosphatase (non-canonical NTP hydrolase)